MKIQTHCYSSCSHIGMEYGSYGGKRPSALSEANGKMWIKQNKQWRSFTTCTGSEQWAHEDSLLSGVWCSECWKMLDASGASLASQSWGPVIMPNTAEYCCGRLSTCHAWITDHSQAFTAAECLPISSAWEGKRCTQKHRQQIMFAGSAGSKGLSFPLSSWHMNDKGMLSVGFRDSLLQEGASCMGSRD